MFMALAKYIDSLFYTTTITTTTTIKPLTPCESETSVYADFITPTEQDAPQSTMTRVLIDMDEGVVTIGEKVVRLQKAIVDRPSLFINGEVNWHSYPQNAYMTHITRVDAADDTPQFFCGPQRLSRRGGIGQWTKSTADDQIRLFRNLSSRAQEDVCTSSWKNLSFSMLSLGESLYLTAQFDTLMTIEIAAIAASSGHIDIVTEAFSLARIILLHLPISEREHEEYNEDTLAGAILTLLV